MEFLMGLRASLSARRTPVTAYFILLGNSFQGKKEVSPQKVRNDGPACELERQRGMCGIFYSLCQQLSGKKEF